PYRVFETLRVAQRALEAGLLRIASPPRAKQTWRAMLAIEESLAGRGNRAAIVGRTAAVDSSPASTNPSPKHPRRTKKRPARPLPVATKADIDGGALVPRIVGAEVGPLAGVVPAAAASGEIDMAGSTRDAPRERLEALMDTGKRERIFPTDVGL